MYKNMAHCQLKLYNQTCYLLYVGILIICQGPVLFDKAPKLQRVRWIEHHLEETLTGCKKPRYLVNCVDTPRQEMAEISRR